VLRGKASGTLLNVSHCCLLLSLTFGGKSGKPKGRWREAFEKVCDARPDCFGI